MKPTYRVRIVLDEDSQFEECNGESRPLTKDEYAENAYQACPQHMRAGTKVIDTGNETRPQVQGCQICGNTEYTDIPYDEYLAYYGNPDRHVYLGCIVEKACPTCGHYEEVRSLWRIDMMDDSPELSGLNIYRKGGHVCPVAEVPSGYLAEVVSDLLHEATHD